MSARVFQRSKQMPRGAAGWRITSQSTALACLLALSGVAPSPQAGPAVVMAAAPRVKLGPLADRPRGGGKVTVRLTPPTVRIGVNSDGRSVTLNSAGGLYIVDRETGRDVWKHLHKGRVIVVLERAAGAADAPIFRVQVASLASLEEAEELRARLETETEEAVTVSRYPDRNAWRVRVGQRATRDEIRQVEDKLRELGFGETWVVQEAPPARRNIRMRLVDEAWNDMVTGARALLAVPAAAGKPVLIGESAFRGVVEVVLTSSRELQAVNVLNVEDYLRGVVPRELGPTLYPEIEALKAQAVAARTYLEANRSQFFEDGFDICDTARCQVYGGIAAEHPLSDLAVEQTRGIIAAFEGRPINALYTATCGGRTEDLRNVFPEMRGPYLKSVSCYPDEATLLAQRHQLKGAWEGTPVLLADGERIDDAIALLEALGVLTQQEARAEFLAQYPAADEVGEWTRRTLRAVGKKAPASGLDRELGSVAALASHLIESFGWGDRLEMLMVPADLAAFLDAPQLAATPEPARAALAWCVKEEILPTLRKGTGGGFTPADPVSRALLARALHRMVLRYDAAGLKAAKVRGLKPEGMALQTEGSLQTFPVASRMHLVIRSATSAVPVASFTVHDGDNVDYHINAAGAVDYLAVKPNARGVSDDRYTINYLWETRISRDDLEDKIRERASVGSLIDLQPGRRGPSGRLLDLTVVGSAGRFRFTGFNIERLLGLRETLFLVDRQHGADGKVSFFTFAGKGWGHGVGMCQVGAYGMALRGSSHQEILQHYYSGITLQKTGS